MQNSNGKVITVLFLAANPTNTLKLRLDEECRSIQNNIRCAEYRDSVCFKSYWAIQTFDVIQAINETRPTIVHFSGHGTSNGDLIFQNPDGSSKIVSKESITTTISTASDTIRLVVFNSCFSNSQAQNIVKNIEAAIGMSSSISDEAACIFAAVFIN